MSNPTAEELLDFIQEYTVATDIPAPEVNWLNWEVYATKKGEIVTDKTFRGALEKLYQKCKGQTNEETTNNS